MKMKGIIVGKHTLISKKEIIGKPKKKYRIIIQERLAKGNYVEKCRSFMIHDFSGRTTVDSVKKKLQKGYKK